MRNVFLSGGVHNPENILRKTWWNSLTCYPHLDLGWEFSVKGEILALEKSRIKLVLMETFYSTVRVSIWTAEQQDSAFGQIVSQHTQPDHTWSLSHMHIFIYIYAVPLESSASIYCISTVRFPTCPFIFFFFFSSFSQMQIVVKETVWINHKK